VRLVRVQGLPGGPAHHPQAETRQKHGAGERVQMRAVHVQHTAQACPRPPPVHPQASIAALVRGLQQTLRREVPVEVARDDPHGSGAPAQVSGVRQGILDQVLPQATHGDQTSGQRQTGLPGV
jgi:hypothetical protein